MKIARRIPGSAMNSSLLSQIQQSKNLKKTVTNDRSAPLGSGRAIEKMGAEIGALFTRSDNGRLERSDLASEASTKPFADGSYPGPPALSQLSQHGHVVDSLQRPPPQARLSFSELRNSMPQQTPLALGSSGSGLQRLATAAQPDAQPLTQPMTQPMLQAGTQPVVQQVSAPSEGWTRHETEDGVPYMFRADTGETMWADEWEQVHSVGATHGQAHGTGTYGEVPMEIAGPLSSPVDLSDSLHETSVWAAMDEPANEALDESRADALGCRTILADCCPHLAPGDVETLMGAVASEAHSDASVLSKAGGTGKGRSGEATVSLPSKLELFKRKLSAGHTETELAIDFMPGTCCIARIDAEAPLQLRSCVFVGDTITSVDGQRVEGGHKVLVEMLDEVQLGRPVLLGVLQPSLLRQMAPLQTTVREKVHLALWVETAGGSAAPTSKDEKGSSKRGMSFKSSRRGSVSGPGHALLVIGGQRVRLFQMRLEGTRQGVLSPDLMGVLLKQGDERKMSLQKWKRRRFELKGGSLYYSEPESGGKLKGDIKLSDPTVEVFADPAKADASLKIGEPHVFVVRTASRRWILRATSAPEKELWVRKIRENIGKQPEPLHMTEDISVATLLDDHLLDLQAVGSMDRLVSQLWLQFPGTTVHLTTPLAKPAVAKIQDAFLHLTSLLGAPIAGMGSANGWLQPQSQDAVFSLICHELTWVAPPAPAANGPPLSPASADKIAGWMATKPIGEAEIPWNKSAVCRRFCILEPLEGVLPHHPIIP